MELVLKPASPEYTAMIVWSPAESAAVDRLACRLSSGTVTGLPPSMVKATVPVGDPDPGGLGFTIAVNVTD